MRGNSAEGRNNKSEKAALGGDLFRFFGPLARAKVLSTLYQPRGGITMREVMLFVVEALAFCAMLFVITAWLYIAAGVIN